MLKKLTFHEIVWYFFIFGILGMFLENIVCFVTSGKIESRKGFIIGPFCPIYGIGAIILIVLLDKQKRNWIKVFFYGSFAGASFEYISSFAMQALYGTKFWDYPTFVLNINGRTCLIYAICWGVLSIALIYLMKPVCDKIIKDFESKKLDIIIFIFMILDTIITYCALNVYMYRANLKYNGMEADSNIISNRAMEIIFPNMLYIIDDGKEIPVSELFES